MKYTVVLTAEYPPIARSILSESFDVVEHSTEHLRSEDDMITLLAEADAAITLLTDPLTRRVLESNPNLRMVANYAVGYNNIDVEAARDLGIVITNTPGVLTEATADMTMAMILAVTRRLVEGDAEVRATGECLWEPLHLLGTSLQGKILGIVGFGRIGRAVADRARAFGMEVRTAGRGDDFRALLRESDIVSIHAPLNEATRHLIDRETLSLMKKSSYLINTARGALVDEEALADALERGALAGAALDVYENEPVVNRRLLSMKNVVILPHIGSATVETRTAMAKTAASDVLRFLSGGAPLHPVS